MSLLTVALWAAVCILGVRPAQIGRFEQTCCAQLSMIAGVLL